MLKLIAAPIIDFVSEVGIGRLINISKATIIGKNAEVRDKYKERLTK